MGRTNIRFELDVPDVELLNARLLSLYPASVRVALLVFHLPERYPFVRSRRGQTNRDDWRATNCPEIVDDRAVFPD